MPERGGKAHGERTLGVSLEAQSYERLLAYAFLTGQSPEEAALEAIDALLEAQAARIEEALALRGRP